MEPFTEAFVIPDSVLGPRDVVVVEGPDALSYLQSQVSQDLRQLAVGASTWTLVLEPAGKVTSLARVTRSTAERFELDTDAGYGADLLARLDRFKIRVKADTSLRPADVDGPPRNEAERIEIGWPAMGHEIVAGETVPQGTGLARIAVSFTKGCYPGQELVERMDSRGAEAPRTLRRLDVPEGSVQGDPVRDGDQVVGEITSVVLTRALAWVKRSSGVGELVQF
jgi:folate-binding protein YgfZ